jgi:hypothetical protein
MGIKIQLLLRKEWRKPEGIVTVRNITSSLGITPTAWGAVTISGEIEAHAFETLFAQKPQQVGSRLPGASDCGSPGGAVAGPLEVPEPLREYVESITVAPPHIRLEDHGKDGRSRNTRVP